MIASWRENRNDENNGQCQLPTRTKKGVDMHGVTGGGVQIT